MPGPATDTSPATTPLSRQLNHTADMVQAVRGGRSLTEALSGVPGALRPATQPGWRGCPVLNSHSSSALFAGRPTGLVGGKQ